jgi:hypothetical protein
MHRSVHPSLSFDAIWQWLTGTSALDEQHGDCSIQFCVGEQITITSPRIRDDCVDPNGYRGGLVNFAEELGFKFQLAFGAADRLQRDDVIGGVSSVVQDLLGLTIQCSQTFED